MWRSRLTLGGIALLLAVSMNGQQEPAELAGVWQMDAARSESAHQAVPIGPVTLVIERNASSVTIETRKGGRKSASTEKLTYFLDGSETSTSAKNGVAVKAKARWNGTKLVTETARNIQGSTVTTMCVFSLDPGGHELTVDRSLTVQHGYQFEGAATTGKAKDVFVRSKSASRR